MYIKCLECGKEFEKRKFNQKFCCAYCRSTYNNKRYKDKIISQRKYPNGFGFANCARCGERFEKSSAVSKFCSTYCRSKYHMELHKEKKSSLYMEDIEDFVYDLIQKGKEAKLNTISSEYKHGMINTSLRDRISLRDNYACKICGADTNLEIHHIVKLIHGGNNNPNNLITLCKSCHRAIDTLNYEHAIKKCKNNFIDNFNNKRITNKNINSILDDCYNEISRLYNLSIEGDLDNSELIKSLNYVLELIENNKTD